MSTRNKRTVEREAATLALAERLNAVIPGAFAGDAHAFLMSVYKNPNLDLHTRIDAAKAAIGYEKPLLASVAMSRRSLDEMSDQETQSARLHS
jgi:hypothetical protein